MLSSLLLVGCAAEADPDESSSDEGEGTSAPPSISASNEASGTVSERRALPEKGCAACGPLPDPWQVFGPLPDPWYESPPPPPPRGGAGGTGSSKP